MVLRKKTALLWGCAVAVVALLAQPDAQVQAFGFGFGGGHEEVHDHDHGHHEHADFYDGMFARSVTAQNTMVLLPLWRPELDGWLTQVYVYV